jgi:hypothetical protein
MKLPEYIQMHTNKPFKWGQNDCVLFAIGWLQLKTGKDYLTEHKPWRTAREASKKLRDLGGLVGLFNNNLISIIPNMAQDGDLTVFDGTACIFSGRHIVSVGEGGLVFRDRCSATMAWRY